MTSLKASIFYKQHRLDSFQSLTSSESVVDMPATSAGGESATSASQPYIAELERSRQGSSRDVADQGGDEQEEDDVEDEDDDGNWEDWQEDGADGDSLGPTYSLFEPKKQLASPEEALAYDHSKFGVDLIDIVQRLRRSL